MQSIEECILDLRLSKIFTNSADYEFVYNFNNELLNAVAEVPPTSKVHHVHEVITKLFKSVDFKKSFSKKMVIIYEEVLLVENLLHLHMWFSAQCCDMRNIIIVTVVNAGVREWYNKYTNIMAERQLTIVDAPWLHTVQYSKYHTSIPKLDKNKIEKNLKYYFSFYGGARSNIERDALVSMMLPIPNGYVDYEGFDGTAQQLDDHLEGATYFLNRQLVDDIMLVRNAGHKFPKLNRFAHTQEYFTGPQWAVDQISAIAPVRETINNTVYTSFTEKTARAFVHFQVVIPLSGIGSVDILTKLGFHMCDLINYDKFQYEPNYINRMQLVISEIRRIQDEYTLGQLQEYILDNRNKFYHNYEIIQTGELADQAVGNIITTLTTSN